jgi:two-component system, OmpR family, phosphate regulon sensor histidine kinase PhoR
MKRLFGAADGDPDDRLRRLEIEAERARILIEESRENVVVVDENLRVVAASRRAKDTIEGLEVGGALTVDLLEGKHGQEPVVVSYELDGRREALVYLGEPGDPAAYEELRAGFTAAVSHELRTPLARLLALLETALLPGSETTDLLEQSRAEVEQMRELIDDVLFLSELETGRATVSLGTTAPGPVINDVLRQLADTAARAGVGLEADVEDGVRLPLRRRMLRMVVENLVENAIRYAGDGATLRLEVVRLDDVAVLRATDDGVGVEEDALGRLFERFYRSDRARASRGTGLGLAIVKHVVTSAGGTVEAESSAGRGLTVTCRFPAPAD